MSIVSGCQLYGISTLLVLDNRSSNQTAAKSGVKSLWRTIKREQNTQRHFLLRPPKSEAARDYSYRTYASQGCVLCKE